MNNRILAAIATGIIMTCSFNAVNAQEYKSTPVTISKEIIKTSDGKLFYAHVVQSKQTIFGIAKAYGVTVKDLMKANPNLEETGLKKDSIILVPVIDDKDKKKESKTEIKQEKVDNSKQTQDVKKDDSKSNNTKSEQTNEYTIHFVRWYESLKDIAKKYNVTEQAILEYNNLVGKKIKNRMKLKIPKFVNTKTHSKDTTDVATTEPADSSDTFSFSSIFKNWNLKKGQINMALMLPFNINNRPNNDSFDFYAGFLVALSDNKDSKNNIDLSVYDCATRIPISQNKINETNVVIGPISTSQLQQVENMSKKSTLLISPLDHKAVSLANNSNFIQIPPQYEDLLNDVVNWVKQDKKANDIVITLNEKGKFNSNINYLDAKIKASGIGSKFFSYNILEGRNIDNSLQGLMTKKGANRIIINSENEAFISDVYRNLNIMSHKEYEVIVYCTSKIKSFENLDIEHLHNMQTHMTTLYYIDYKSDKVKNFVRKYRALYNNEPSQFAFQGYDICQYLISLANKYGNEWPKYLDKFQETLLQTNINLNKIENGGFVNKGTRRIIYKQDYNIEAVK